MSNAARANLDTTTHASKPLSGPTGSEGSPNVSIGGSRAWRALIDVHQCPLTTGTVPHAIGVVVGGSQTVFINGVPAARQGDEIVEAGPPNKIATGCQNVTIG